MKQLLHRPLGAQLDVVYSNFDHELDPAVVAKLEEQDDYAYAQHAARSFCGYVWKTSNGLWVDQIWQFGSPVEDIVGDSLEQVISEANERYGEG